MPKLPRAAFVLASLALLTCFACDSAGSREVPTAAAGSQVQLAGADVLIDGQSVAGQSIAPGSGSATLFTVTLVDPADTVRVQSMVLEYPRHSMMGMTGGTATMALHDDGMQCDPVAGDGHYCYLDDDGHIGPHDPDCPQGDYVYRFHGVDMMGELTNSIECRVRVL